MRLAFISDIHGNANALDAVLDNINKQKADKIFVLGDICYRGPEPQRSLDIVRSLNTDVIKGNADEWVLRGVNKGEVPDSALDMMNRERDWIYDRLNRESIEYLRNLPSELKLEVEDCQIHAFHATPTSLFDVVLPHESDEKLMGKMMVEDVGLYIYAHIHKPYIRYLNGKCIMNLGSVGLPFDGSTNASYALVDILDGELKTSIVRVEYDINLTIQQFKESDYPNREQLIRTIMNGKLS